MTDQKQTPPEPSAVSPQAQPDLAEFIENVNKKDKVHGKKVTFGFVKRKRGK